ncbi:hypothetical protein BGW38_001383, partial [Lunasporangiospora selenospora]
DPEDAPQRVTGKGYSSDHSLSWKRRRLHDKGIESMSERESMSELSSGDEDEEVSQQQQQPTQLSSVATSLFTLDERDEEGEEDDDSEEVSDMEKLRYKYEYEIKAAIHSAPVLSEVINANATTMMMPYGVAAGPANGGGAFVYGVPAGMQEYVAYGYPQALNTPVTLAGVGGLATPGAGMFTTAMAPTASAASTCSSTSSAGITGAPSLVSATAGVASAGYPLVHTAALPPSHHHQEYLEFTLGSILPNIPI